LHGNKESTRNSKLSLPRWTRRCTIIMASGSITQTWLTILKPNKWKEVPKQWQGPLVNKKSQHSLHKCQSFNRQKMIRVSFLMLARANFYITGNLELPQDRRPVASMEVWLDLTSRKLAKAHMSMDKIKKVDWAELAFKDLMKSFHKQNHKEDLDLSINRALDLTSRVKLVQSLHHISLK